MRKASPSLIKRYTRMSGDTKIQLGLSLSQTVRKIRQEGIADAKKY